MTMEISRPRLCVELLKRLWLRSIFYPFSMERITTINKHKISTQMKAIINATIILFIFTNDSFSQVPDLISYQGVLYKDDDILPDGTYETEFTLYNEFTEGNALWTEMQSVAVENGVFNVQLGKSNPFDFLIFDSPLWLGVNVGGEELLPRINLTAVPYSLHAKTVEDESITSQKIADNQVIRSVNNLKDNITITGGQNVQVETSGNNLIINVMPEGNGGNTTPNLEESLENPLGYGNEFIVIDPENIINDKGESVLNFTIPQGKTIRFMDDYNYDIRFIDPDDVNDSSPAPPMEQWECYFPNLENCDLIIPISKNLLVTDHFYDPNDDNYPRTVIAIGGLDSDSRFIPCSAPGIFCSQKIFATLMDRTFEPVVIANQFEYPETISYQVSPMKKLVITQIEWTPYIRDDLLPIHPTLTFKGNEVNVNDLPLPIIFDINTIIVLKGDVRLFGYLK